MTRTADRRTRSGPAMAVVLLFGLLIGYPLSVGPAMLVCDIAGEPEFLVSALETFYEPLEALPKSILGPLVWWADLWQDLASKAEPPKLG